MISISAPYRLARTASAPECCGTHQFRRHSDLIGTHLDHALLRLNLRIMYFAVVDNNGISTGASRIWIRPADALGELGVGVREEQDIVPPNVVRLPPGTHDKRIIGRDDGNDVDALLAEVREVLDIAGDMAHGASRGEGAYTAGLEN